MEIRRYGALVRQIIENLAADGRQGGQGGLLEEWSDGRTVWGVGYRDGGGERLRLRAQLGSVSKGPEVGAGLGRK